MSSIRKWLAVLLVLSLWLLAACTPSTEVTEPSGTFDDFVTVPLPTGEDGNVTYRVTVLTESGEPVPGAFLQLTLNESVPAVTDDQGVATWSLPQGAYAVSFVQLPAGYDYTGAAQEFFFKDNSGEMTITLMAAQ